MRFYLFMLLISVSLFNCCDKKIADNNRAYENHIHSQVTCENCYECTAYIRIDQDYYRPIHTDKLFSQIEVYGKKMHSIADAEQRYEYFLDYGEGDLTYDLVVCDCDTTTLEAHSVHMQEVMNDAGERYARYLEKRFPNKARKTGYKVPR